MAWTFPWRRGRLSLRFALYLPTGSLAVGLVALQARWLYAHPDNPVIGSALSVMADFVPMAIATAGIIMSYKAPKKENHLLATLVLIACGFAGTGILTLARIRSEEAHKVEVGDVNKRLQLVADQNQQILTGVTSTRPAVIESAPA